MVPTHVTISLTGLNEVADTIDALILWAKWAEPTEADQKVSRDATISVASAMVDNFRAHNGEPTKKQKQPVVVPLDPTVID